MADEETKTDAAADAPTETVEEAAPAPEEKKEEAPAAKAPAESDVKEEVEVPAKFKKFIEEIEKMSVLELHELVKVFEKKFDVSAQAVAVAGPATAGDGGDDEQDSFTVELKDAGSQKIAIIKVVKSLLGLGLKEAKDIVDSVPAVLKEGVKKEEAEEIKALVAEAGGAVELK